jgi:RNA polymerase sigma-70 factor (ECF subfamily)
MSEPFPSTRWSLVLAARIPDQRGAALEALCRAYWPPVYSFVRRRGHAPDDAADLTQSFFVRILEKDALAGAARDRGRFRSFLLACVKNFLANEWDRAHAEKRGGTMLSFAFPETEEWLGKEPIDIMTPERIFDRCWATTILDRALSTLAAEYERAGRPAMFLRLKPFLLDDSDESLKSAAASLGLTQGALKMTVFRLRRRYRSLIEAEIAGTVHDPAEIQDELHHLRNALQKP